MNMKSRLTLLLGLGLVASAACGAVAETKTFSDAFDGDLSRWGEARGQWRIEDGVLVHGQDWDSQRLAIQRSETYGKRTFPVESGSRRQWVELPIRGNGWMHETPYEVVVRLLDAQGREMAHARCDPKTLPPTPVDVRINHVNRGLYVNCESYIPCFVNENSAGYQAFNRQMRGFPGPILSCDRYPLIGQPYGWPQTSTDVNGIYSLEERIEWMDADGERDRKPLHFYLQAAEHTSREPTPEELADSFKPLARHVYRIRNRKAMP